MMASPARPLAGRSIIVTGANQGIGKEAAAELAARGASVTLACRDTAAAEAAAADIRRRHPHADVSVGPPLDLGSTDSVRAFASSVGGGGSSGGGRASGHPEPLHVLVNNAGANYLPQGRTPEGVCTLAQVNYLGPYLLTRLLEPRLAAGAPSRVVNVSSIMSRFGEVGNAQDFLTSPDRGGEDYAATKLANVLFTYESQRRLAPLGIQSCAVDPGSVNTAIYRNNRVLGHGPFRAVREFFCSPPSEGAAAVVDAATVPWAAPAVAGSSSDADVPRRQLRFYGRGLFGTPPVTWMGGPYHGMFGAVRRAALAPFALLSAALDQPVRNLSGGRLGAMTRQVPSSPSSYDRELAAALWNLSADTVGVPRDVGTAATSRK